MCSSDQNRPIQLLILASASVEEPAPQGRVAQKCNNLYRTTPSESGQKGGGNCAPPLWASIVVPGTYFGHVKMTSLPLLFFAVALDLEVQPRLWVRLPSLFFSVALEL